MLSWSWTNWDLSGIEVEETETKDRCQSQIKKSYYIFPTVSAFEDVHHLCHILGRQSRLFNQIHISSNVSS